MDNISNIGLTTSSEVIAFIEETIESVQIENLVPTVIYGKFPDEAENNYRVSLTDRAELGLFTNHCLVSAPPLKELLIPTSLVNSVKNKTINLLGDTVVFL